MLLSFLPWQGIHSSLSSQRRVGGSLGSGDLPRILSPDHSLCVYPSNASILDESCVARCDVVNTRLLSDLSFDGNTVSLVFQPQCPVQPQFRFTRILSCKRLVIACVPRRATWFIGDIYTSCMILKTALLVPHLQPKPPDQRVLVFHTDALPL